MTSGILKTTHSALRETISVGYHLVVNAEQVVNVNVSVL